MPFTPKPQTPLSLELESPEDVSPVLGSSEVTGGRPTRFQTVWHGGAEWIAALGGALFVGGLVAFVNLQSGLSAALLAGGKQALWTGVMAGLLTRFCRYLCTQTSFRLFPPQICATLGPSLLAVLGVTVLHHLEGTAHPWASVMVTVILAPPGFWLVAHNMRRANAATESYNLGNRPS